MDKRWFFLLLVICLVSVLDAGAQTTQFKLDSLIMVAKNHPKEDSARFVILKNIFIQTARLKNDQQVEQAAAQALRLAGKLKKPALAAGMYYRLGLYYHGTNKYLKAESNYFKSIEKYTQVNDLDWVAGNYQNLGALYTIIPDYAKALEANQKAVAIYQQLGDESSFADIYTNIAVLYQDLGQYSESLLYLKRSLKEFLKDNEPNRGAAVVYEAMGSAYLKASDAELRKMGVNPQQKNKLALTNYHNALQLAETIKDVVLSASLYGKIGLTHENEYEYEAALNAYNKSIELYRKEGKNKNYAYSLLALAEYYLHRNDFSKSKPLLLEALQIGNAGNLIDLQRDVYQSLSLNEEKLTNYNQALLNYKQYVQLRDQIFDEEKEKEVTRKRLALDFSIKEKDYKYKQSLTDNELTLRAQQLALIAKEKSLQRLTFLKKQVDLENEKQHQVNLLKQQELSAKLDKELNDRKINLQQTQIKFNKKLNLFLGVLAVILSGAALFVYYNHRKTVQLNKVISEQKAELERLGKVKDRIFSIVGHDMRSPVNSLISFIQLLEEGEIDQEKLNKYAGLLKDSLSHTSAMMENLLNWALSQMQGFKPAIEKFDLLLCTEEVVKTLTPIADRKHIRIENTTEAGIFCWADVNMTKLVLRNLINNAIKFTRKSGVIKLTVAKNEQQLFISVSDNGVGLSPEQAANFNREGFDGSGISTPGTNNEKGTGIGLMLCHTFTGLMNGNLKVKSKENEGTVFTLTLPKAL